MKSNIKKIIKKLGLFSVTFVLLLSCMALSKSVDARKPILYILNESGVDCTASYFSTSDGSWNNPSEDLVPNKLTRTELIHDRLYNNATYWMTVGQKMGAFYCAAVIEIPAFGKDIVVLDHQGNCHFSQSKDGKLVMVVEPAKNYHQARLLADSR